MRLLKKAVVIAFCGFAVGSAVALGMLPMSTVRPAIVPSAQAAEVRTEQRKLVGTSWHCWGSFPCELWYLTRPARPGETAGNVSFMSDDFEEMTVYDETAEVAPSNCRVNMALPDGVKLSGVGWKCYGGGQCKAFLQIRPRRKGEAAESYLFHNGTECYGIKETP